MLAEQRYPSAAHRRRRSEGERCDIVLTRETDPARNHLIDPLEAGTLFGGGGVAPEEALWIEVKVAWRHALIDGAPRPDPRYATTLRRHAAADLRKLAADERIHRAALALVLFSTDEAMAEADITTWRSLASVEGWPVAEVREGVFAMTDRIGNAACGVVLAEAALRREPRSSPPRR